MDLGRAPIRVLFRQAPDQHANLFVDLGPASAGAGAPAPVEAEPGAMPADDGFGFDNDENFGPPGPATAEAIQKTRSSRSNWGRGRLLLRTASVAVEPG